jgi:hypothetical protein
MSGIFSARCAYPDYEKQARSKRRQRRLSLIIGFCHQSRGRVLGRELGIHTESIRASTPADASPARSVMSRSVHSVIGAFDTADLSGQCSKPRDLLQVRTIHVSDRGQVASPEHSAALLS